MPTILSAQSECSKPKLLEQVRTILRSRYYSLRTEEAYLGWMRRFILFQGKRHPQEMDGAEVAASLIRAGLGQKRSSKCRGATSKAEKTESEGRSLRQRPGKSQGLGRSAEVIQTQTEAAAERRRSKTDYQWPRRDDEGEECANKVRVVTTEAANKRLRCPS